MSRNGTGVEPRDKSIRVGFTFNGEFVRETLKLAPTPPNIKYATALVARVNKSIRDGSFVYVDYFPESKRVAADPAVILFGQACDNWLATKGRLATKTKRQYANALLVWRGMLGESVPIAKITHTTLATKIGSHPWASAKLLNNYLITLRGVFKLAGREVDLGNPMEGIENSKHQSTPPDPLSRGEMESIMGWLADNVDERVWAYYEFAFMTGMRPEEIIALKWEDYDVPGAIIHVSRARSSGEIKPLKTYNSRDVELVKRAVEALNTMRPYTSNHDDGFIFQNPVTKRPWHDERSQRDHYWKPALQAKGIRYRRSYQTRHTFAANNLAAGVNPTYVARQMGHINAKN
jgi:integrase